MLAAITFDVDGLQRDPFASEPTTETRRRLQDLSHDVVLPRIAEWLRSLDVRATFFSIGADVKERPRIYRQLAADGHEIANHSHSHLRDFSKQAKDVIRAEIRNAHDTIVSEVGVAPVGFRCPGYTVTADVIDELTSAGYAYDASLIPSWSYTTLKRAYQLLGGPQYRSYLVPQGYGCAMAPRLPYRVGAADLYRQNPSATLTELPITTLGPMQLPFVHGLTYRLPKPVRDSAIAAALRQPFFTLSFHDLEFADRPDFGPLPASSMTTPHLARPIADRLSELSALVRTSQRTHRFVTMRESIGIPRA